MKTITTTFFLKRFFLILCLGNTATSLAQNIAADQVRWHASGFTDLLSNAVVSDAPCEFITHGIRKVEWVQGNGSYVMTLNVTGTSGVWADVSSPGMIVFSVSGDEGVTGHITFARDDNGMKVELDLRGGTADIKNSYSIATLEKI